MRRFSRDDIAVPATPEMITLRTYSSSTEAGLAKAHLDAAGINCELADENSNPEPSSRSRFA